MDGLNITNERITAEDLDRLQDWHLRDERTRQMNTVEDFKNAPVGATATLGDGRRAMKKKIDRFPWVTTFDYVRLSSAELVEKGYILDQPTPTTASEALELSWELAHEVKPGQAIPKGTRYLEFHNSTVKEYTAQIDCKIRPEFVPAPRTLEPLPDPKPDWLDQPTPTTASEALELAWELAYPVWEGQNVPKGTRYLKTNASGLAEFIAQFDFKILPGVVSVVRTLERLPGTVPDWVYAPAVLASTSMCPDRKVWVPESGGVWKCSCCRDELHWYELVEVAPLYPPNEGTKYGTTAPEGYTPSNSMGLKNEDAEEM